MEPAMRYRSVVILLASVLAGPAMAQSAKPPVTQASDKWSAPSSSSTSAGTYRDALSTAASDAERFKFSNQGPKDNAPPDQSPIRVIINNGRGPHVNCIPMGMSGACH
jgi:hypothetical protein